MHSSHPIIREASSDPDYRAFSQLIGEYVAWLRGRYEQDAGFISEVLDTQSLASELADLPAIYGRPSGRAFVAVHGQEVRGCAAYRWLANGTCEMKRVFVPSRFQGAGLGRKLCSALILAAREDGYQTMKLDTGRRMTEAISLYQSLGFQECPGYMDYPSNLMPHFVFMALPLAQATANAHRSAQAII